VSIIEATSILLPEQKNIPMKSCYSLLLSILIVVANSAQTTAIPDVNFEQVLINLGYDTGTPDGEVMSNRIDTVTILNVSYWSISDLTGIEDFTSLKKLVCENNQLSNLNVSQNFSLKELYCNDNQLISLDLTQNNQLDVLNCNVNQLTNLNVTQNIDLYNLACGGNPLSSLDVTQNTMLTELNCVSNLLNSIDLTENTLLVSLNCVDNQFTSLDLTGNVSLKNLYCFGNQLVNLDLSQNIFLENLYCFNNQLTNLNVKNGNNTNIIQFDAASNPNLTCIEVDNDLYSSTNWTNIDVQSSFSTDCAVSVGIAANSLTSLTIFPNPVSDVLNLRSDVDFESVVVIDISGRVVDNVQQFNSQFNVSNLERGVYFLQVTFSSDTVKLSFIKE
jgi:Leucine-rich repeat (LRR) protein